MILSLKNMSLRTFERCFDDSRSVVPTATSFAVRSRPSQLDGYVKKINNPNFEKAPDNVREAALEKKEQLEKELQLLAAAIDNIAPLVQRTD